MSEEKEINSEFLKSIIKWQEATHLIHAYNTSGKPKLTGTFDINGRSQDEAISGFSIDKSELEGLFNDDEITRIFVAIGYHDGTIRAEHTVGHSGIFFGMDSQDRLKISITDHILNYSSPCPKRCPRYSDGTIIDLKNIQPIPFTID